VPYFFLSLAASPDFSHDEYIALPRSPPSRARQSCSFEEFLSPTRFFCSDFLAVTYLHPAIQKVLGHGSAVNRLQSTWLPLFVPPRITPPSSPVAWEGVDVDNRPPLIRTDLKDQGLTPLPGPLPSSPPLTQFPSFSLFKLSFRSIRPLSRDTL